jgi:hypothetical protein
MFDGCVLMQPGHLYPVLGPLSDMSPPPTYTASLSGGVLNSGSITVHLAAGISCSGSWKAVSGDDPTARQMLVAWDEVYGSGYFVANVLGKRTFARAVLTCTDSEKLNLEFLVVEPGDASSTIGVVSDGKGNVFKLSFS